MTTITMVAVGKKEEEKGTVATKIIAEVAGTIIGATLLAEIMVSNEAEEIIERVIVSERKTWVEIEEIMTIIGLEAAVVRDDIAKENSLAQRLSKP